jgi:hypothetical protein
MRHLSPFPPLGASQWRSASGSAATHSRQATLSSVLLFAVVTAALVAVLFARGADDGTVLLRIIKITFDQPPFPGVGNMGCLATGFFDTTAAAGRDGLNCKLRGRRRSISISTTTTSRTGRDRHYREGTRPQIVVVLQQHGFVVRYKPTETIRKGMAKRGG